MIGRIKGTVVYIDSDHAIVDVSGVGYIVHCSSKTLSIMELNSIIILFIETHVREDQISLYGFISQQEKWCFLKLTTVKGIGSKLALLILGSLSIDKIYSGIASKDQVMFSGISGIGPKIITRIFTELKPEDFYNAQSKSEILHGMPQESLMHHDAISALINLGINRIEASRVVSNTLSKQKEIDLNSLIKISLSEVAK